MSKIIFSIVAVLMCAMPALAFTGDYYPTEGYDESYHGTGMYVLTAGDLEKLASSDDNRYVSYAVWNNRNYNDYDYIEFDFSPDLPSCAVVESVIITFEWQRTDTCYNINTARLKIWDQSSASWFIDNFPTPLPLLYIDRTEIINAPYINTVEDVNNLKIWFQVSLNPAYPPADVTKHDLVKLTVTYSIPCDCYTDMPSCEQNECDWCPLCDDTRVNQWYEGTCVESGSDCGYHCDTDYCGAECEGCDCQGYCSGNIRYFGGACLDTCFCSFQSEDCDSYDGWYDTCSKQWVPVDQCNEKEQKEQKYRDYYCDPEGCAYNVIDNQWVDTGSTRYKESACDDGLYCTVDDMCIQGACVGAERDCSGLDNQCQAGVCDEELDSCVPDYTNYPLSTPCEADEDLCTVDHCDGLGSCVKDYDVDCSYLDTSYCSGDDVWEDVGYCSQGECYAESFPVEYCYYYVEYCSENDDIVYNEGYCDQSTVTCSYETGFIESCYFYNEFCSEDSRMAEEGFCNYDTVTCDSEFCEVEDCSVYNYEDCQDTYYKHYYTESCYEDQEQTQCLPSSSLIDCRDDLWCNGQEYCSELDGVHCEAGEPVDCSGNDIPEVATCYFDPDNFASTFDWRCAFVSECVENGCNSGYCSQGDETVSHVCADGDDTDGVFNHGGVQVCEAECDGAGEECEPRIIGDYCYYGGECNTDPTVCSCKFAYDDYCPMPGTVVDDICYYGEGSCSEEGCYIDEEPIRPCEYCDPLLGPMDITPPVVSDISVNSPRCCETAEITALAEDPMGCNNIVEAEYFFVTEGGCGDPGTGVSMNAQDGYFDSPSEIVEALINVPCPDGAYNLWIRAKDAAGNWGECTFYMVIVQNSAPTTYNVYVEDLTVTATIEGLSVVGAEYFIDWMGPSGLGTPMDAVDGTFDSYIEDVIGELDPGLSPGLHRVYVHGKDNGGYWGLFAYAEFTVYEGPEITITAPAPGWYKGIITVSHTTAGTVCDYRYVDNGTESAWFSITCNADFDFDTASCMDGEPCVIELRASNGLFYGYDAVTITVDNSAPIITYVSAPAQAERNETINITSDGHDPQGLKSCWAFLMSGEDVIESYNLGLDCADEELIPDVADGNYIIRVRARNNADTDSFAETGLIVGEGAPPSPPSPPGGSPSGGYYSSSVQKECVEKWVCSEWSECTGTQVRECIDENACGTVSSKPAEEQACEMPEEEVPEEEPEEEVKVPAVGITGLLIGALTDPLTAFIILIGIIILAYLLYRILKRGGGKKKKGSVSMIARKKAKRRKK